MNIILILLSSINVALLIINLSLPRNRIRQRTIHYIGWISILISLYYTKLIFVIPKVVYILLSIPISYICYLTSLFIVGTKFSKSNLLFTELKCLNVKAKEFFFKEIISNFKSSTYEELIYRGLIQFTIYSVSTDVYMTIIMSTIYFAGVHYEKGKPIVQWLDIISFSLIITLLFQTTYDIWLVIIIHILRNLLVICQKYIQITQRQNRILELSKKIKSYS